MSVVASRNASARATDVVPKGGTLAGRSCHEDEDGEHEHDRIIAISVLTMDHTSESIRTTILLPGNFANWNSMVTNRHRPKLRCVSVRDNTGGAGRGSRQLEDETSCSLGFSGILN